MLIKISLYNNKHIINEKSKIKTIYKSVTIKMVYDFNKLHYHIIIDEINNNYISVGITSKRTKNKLKINPINSDKDSYLFCLGTIKPKNKYKKIYDSLILLDDYNKALKYAIKAKEKYLKNQIKSIY